MKSIGTLFTRISSTLIMVLLVVAIAVPGNSSVTAAAAFTPDDFNRCSFNTSLWTYENPLGLAAPTISGQYQGNAVLNINIPTGTQASFSNSNKDAPRIMQNASDEDFEVEVKFNSPLGLPQPSTSNIQGILVKDSTSVPGKTRWLRFDLDTSGNGNIHYYVAYVDENGLMTSITGPGIISTAVNAAPLYLRVKYEKALQQWTIAYRLGDAGNFTYRYTFQESALPGGVNFVVSQIGVFAGTTGAQPTGLVSQIDYIRSVPDAFVDDEFTINVQTTGQGSVNWPMTSPSQCSGTQVTLTASPLFGSTFSGWSGDVGSANSSIQLQMNRSYNLVANFTGGAPIEYDFSVHLPVIVR